MAAEFDSEASKSFVQVAQQRGLLTSHQATDLLHASLDRTLDPGVVAIEQKLLRSHEVDIVRVFMNPTDLAPGYKVLDVLGHGALGIVFVARQAQLQRDVAIKSILQDRLNHPNVAARFQQEGEAIGRLHHPNIVSAYDSGTHSNRLFLVMEFVKGQDLRDRLKEEKLDVSTALSITRQTASGLAHALSEQVIHRDIKPGNLILTSAPAGFDLPPGVPLVKIADFGLARFNTLEEGDDAQLTIAGTTLGTPMYCAPEQLTGDQIDHRADIYALGSTLFHIIVGEPPMEEDKVSKVMAAKIGGESIRSELLPDDLNPAVKKLILDMTAHDPEQRIPDYDTLIDRIDSIDDRSKIAKNKRVSRRSARGMTLAVVAAGLLGTWLWAVGVLSPKEITPTLTEGSVIRSLYNGKTAADWIGEVVVDRSSLEGDLLKISNGRAFHALHDYLLDSPKRFGVQVSVKSLEDTDAAEIHFGFANRPSFKGDRQQVYSESARFVLRFTPDAVLFGTRESWDGKWVERSRFDEAPSLEKDKLFQFALERHDDRWLVRFGDHYFGEAEVDIAGDNFAIQLAVPEGSAHFADIQLFELVEQSVP